MTRTVYQFRIVICREGRLEKRHVAFQAEGLGRLEGRGSKLIGAWEVIIGQDAGCAIYQLRQFESMAVWETYQLGIQEAQARHRERSKKIQQKIYPYLDEVHTYIIRSADDMTEIPKTWPAIDTVRGQDRGYIEMRILDFRPGTVDEHHAFYRKQMIPALAREGAQLIGFFDTWIGPGSVNDSLRSFELRRFPDLASWQRWHELRDTNPELRQLVKTTWLSRVRRVESMLLRPMDYSLIR